MALALRAIGAEARLAIPALHSALDFTNQTPYFRIEVAWAIWSIARDTNLVLKVCTNALHTDQAAIRATWMLADIGESARETAPLLLQVLQDTNRAERLRSTAAWALGAMLPRESRAFPALAAATSDAMPLVRLYAAAALWKADNRHVSNAVPVIVESLLALRQSEYQEGSEDFAQFVEHFQLPVNDCVPSLKNLLDGGSPAIREAATNALQKIGAQLAVEKPRE